MTIFGAPITELTGEERRLQEALSRALRTIAELSAENARLHAALEIPNEDVQTKMNTDKFGLSDLLRIAIRNGMPTEWAPTAMQWVEQVDNRIATLGTQLTEAAARTTMLENEIADAARVHGLVCDDRKCTKEAHDCLRDKLAEAKLTTAQVSRDRDEWRAQHENLLHIRAQEVLTLIDDDTHVNVHRVMAEVVRGEPLLEREHVAFQAKATNKKALEIAREQLAEATARAEKAEAELVELKADCVVQTKLFDSLDAENARLREGADNELGELLELERALMECLSGVDCPHCDNSGGYPVQRPYGYIEQQQCEWCYTFPYSKFNVTQSTGEPQ